MKRYVFGTWEAHIVTVFLISCAALGFSLAAFSMALVALMKVMQR